MIDRARVAGFIRDSSLALLLTGCAHYAAQPVDPRANAQQLQSRRLDDPAVGAALAQQAGVTANANWPPASFDTEQLLRAAMVLNPDLAAARARLRSAIAAVGSARMLPNPTLGLAMDRYQQEQAGSSLWGWSLALDFPLGEISQRGLHGALADARSRAARNEYLDQLWQVRAAIRSSLLELLSSQQQALLMQRSLTDTQALATVYRQRLDDGEGTPSDFQQAQLAVLQNQREAAEVNARHGAALTQLARAIGVSSTAIEALPLHWRGFDAPQLPGAEQLLALRDAALLSRHDVEQALADYDAREYELHLQVRAQYPQFSLGPGYTYDHGIRKLDLNASLSLPIFNRNAGPIAEAEARRAEAGAHLEAVQAQVLSEIEAARRLSQQSLLVLQQAKQQSTLSEQLARQTRTGVDLGAEDRVALLSACIAATRAALAESLALSQTQRSLGALEDSLRNPLEAP